MFQFRAFPSYTYLIQCMILRYCLSVFPHSEISGSQLICSSPKLIAACRVLHRLLMPRHSPCALISLTFVRENFTPLHPPCGGYPLRSISSSSPIQTRLRWALNREKWFSFFWFSELCRFNRSSLQNCIYPFKKFHNAVVFASFNAPLCCLAFSFFPLFSFQGAIPAEPGGGE